MHLVEDRKANIVMYSMFALPEEETERNRLLETALAKGNIIHFVNEGLALVTEDDLKTIRKYLDFAKYGRSILPIGLPLSDTTKMFFNKWSTSLAKYHQAQ